MQVIKSVAHYQRAWAKPTVSSCARDRESGATPMRRGQVKWLKWWKRHQSQFYRLTRAASPNSLVLCTSAFLDNFIFCPCASVSFIAEMRVIALLNRAIGCESCQPLLLDRILRLPFAAVDLGDVPQIEPARHGLFRALRLQIGGLFRRQKRQLWVKFHSMREVTLARPRATSLLILL